MLSPRSRPVNELTNEELKEVILKNCHSLDKKAHSLAQVKTDQADDPTKDLQNRIKQLEEDLARKQRRRNNLLKQVRGIKAFTTANSRARPNTVKHRVGTAQTSKNRTEVIRLLTDYQQKYQDPNVDAALMILTGHGSPEQIREMVDVEDDSNGFNDLLNRRTQTHKYRQQTDAITSEKDEYDKQIQELVNHQNNLLAEYETQVLNKNQIEAEYDSLYPTYRQKQEEADQARRIEEQIEAVRQEIENIMSNPDENTTSLVNMRERDMINRLKSENESLEADVASLEEENKRLKSRVGETNLSGPAAIVRRELSKILSDSSQDSFGNSKLEQFLTQMESHGISPKEFVAKSKEKEELEQNIRKIQQEINELETNTEKLQQETKPKLDQISQLEANLKTLANKLGTQATVQEHTMPEFKDGAPSIQFKSSVIKDIGDDQTAIIIYFKNFHFEKSFIGKKPSHIFLVVDFLEHQSINTKAVDINSGVFDDSLTFVCKNDFFLREYIERTSASCQLCRRREDTVTEAAATELNLLPFLKGHHEITQTVPFWNKSDKLVGNITFEAAIYRPPISSKSENEK